MEYSASLLYKYISVLSIVYTGIDGLHKYVLIIRISTHSAVSKVPAWIISDIRLLYLYRRIVALGHSYKQKRCLSVLAVPLLRRGYGSLHIYIYMPHLISRRWQSRNLLRVRSTTVLSAGRSIRDGTFSEMTHRMFCRRPANLTQTRRDVWETL